MQLEELKQYKCDGCKETSKIGEVDPLTPDEPI